MKTISPFLCSSFLIAFAGQSFALTQSDKLTIQHAVESSITSHYVETSKIPKIMALLETLNSSSEWQLAETEEQVAHLLTDTLQQVDKHFAVNQIPTTTTTEKKEPWFHKLARKNYGFTDVAVLDGNIGYLSFWGFADVTPSLRAKLASVMKVLEDVDALIIDLRENGGGSAQMVQLLSGYFLPEKTHLNSFYNRQTDATTEFWSETNIAGKVRADIPLYILTGPNTFSAAEEFSYNMKHLKRGVIVGEKTKGGANPWQYFPLEHTLRIALPVSKAINPITKTNWENVGVLPDVAVAAKKAKTEAYYQAIQLLLKTSADQDAFLVRERESVAATFNRELTSRND